MATSHIAGPVKLKDSYRRIGERIAAAAERSGRTRDDVLLVAVTKTADPDQLRSLVDLGHTDLGESRVQMLTQRAAALEEFLSRKRTLGAALTPSDNKPTEVRWHMIGHLQRNKVKRIVPLVKLIHSVDSLRVAEEIHGHAAQLDQVIDVLVQVNTSGDPARHGVAPAAVTHLADQIGTMMHLRLRGLMAMAPAAEDTEHSRPVFARAAELFHEVRTDQPHGAFFNVLSMGMSDDFEVAIEEGANVVRVGRALFGEADPE